MLKKELEVDRGSTHIDPRSSIDSARLFGSITSSRGTRVDKAINKATKNFKDSQLTYFKQSVFIPDEMKEAVWKQIKANESELLFRFSKTSGNAAKEFHEIC